MPTFTVHAPPPRAGKSKSDPQRFRFVRDGFHVWAFLLAPLWLLVHRLWLVLFGYVVASALIGVLFYVVGASGGLKFLGTLLFALLVGFEAASLQRWTLTRRGWQMLGFVVGDNAENAEQRFFAEWASRPRDTALPPPTAAESQYASPVRRGPPSGSDVIGLFPEPGRSP